MLKVRPTCEGKHFVLYDSNSSRLKVSHLVTWNSKAQSQVHTYFLPFRFGFVFSKHKGQHKSGLSEALGFRGMDGLLLPESFPISLRFTYTIFFIVMQVQ